MGVPPAGPIALTVIFSSKQVTVAGGLRVRLVIVPSARAPKACAVSASAPRTTLEQRVFMETIRDQI